MPRLSNQLYLKRHQFLAKAWADFPRLYTILPPHEQWDVHDFYVPTKGLTDEQLLEHRESVSKDRPALPAQAGKCFARMYQAFRVAFEYAQGDQRRFNEALSQFTESRAATVTTHGKRQIRVTGLVRPEPDYELLAQALVAMAEQRVKERHRQEAQ